MTQLSVAPQQPPMLSPQQAAPAPGAEPDPDPAAAAGEGLDFASVLGQHIALPAKAAADTANIAALLPSGPAEAADDTVAAEAPLPVAPDLAGLLAFLAGQMAKEPEAVAQPESGIETDVQPLPGMTAEVPALPQAAPLQLAADAPRGPQNLSVAEAGAATTHPKSAPAMLQAAVSPTAIGTDPAPAAPVPPAWLSGAAGQPQRADAASAVVAEASAPLAPAAFEQADPLAAGRSLQASAATARESREVLRIDTPVGARGWDGEVANKIVLLAGREEGRAELTLTPPQLGRVEITISVQGDQTSAAFVSASPAAREALEQALPRLREILAEAGITLGQASVNAESARQGRDDAPSHGPGEGRGRESARSGEAPAQWLRRSNGLIDTFA